MVAKKKETVKKEDKRLQDYELVFVVSPQVADEALDTTISGVSQFITSREGVVAEVVPWGRKKLAYPIRHSLEGNYVLAKFSMKPARCRELEANLRISEQILRHLLIKVGS
jgi:small subunit ribosomal protein S6